MVYFSLAGRQVCSGYEVCLSVHDVQTVGDIVEKTAQGVAEWMVQEIKFTGTLHQEAAIEYVKTHFGEEFVFMNENGNSSLSKEVKKAFRKLHRGQIAWDRDAFMWAWT